MRKSDSADIGSGEDCEERRFSGRTYVVMQICISSIKRTQTCSMKCIRVRSRLHFMDQDLFYFQSLSL